MGCNADGSSGASAMQKPCTFPLLPSSLHSITPTPCAVDWGTSSCLRLGAPIFLLRKVPQLLMCTVQVPMYSASGLRVQYLKVWEKSGYKVDKWVRKVCKSGDYNIRT